MTSEQPRRRSPVPPITSGDVAQAEKRVGALNRALHALDHADNFGYPNEFMDAVEQVLHVAPESVKAIERYQGAPKGHL
ncbi:hypothetical protein ACFC1T_08735 [Kitasatospora sp. NPDC056076]|uniref:hypothetical protein n=1 Tax=Kitasatospora sp. NPDC056076 TaxID=3345703 RepID=UPI0035E26DE7